MTYPREPQRKCNHGRCVLYPTEGSTCYYHSKVETGLIDPDRTSAYSKRVIEDARVSEMARLKAELGVT
jgi:hypothetical protein